ncbi:MAG: flagellar basal body L-ring protein FlgH [Acidobacteriota bacterium]|jgi:flagellar L-ring protein precursor FlgH
MKAILGVAILLFGVELGWGRRKPPMAMSPLDQYIQEAVPADSVSSVATTPGSLFRSGSRYSELGRDFRAQNVDDLVTIQVVDRASAVARGVTNSNRTSSVKQGVTAALGTVAVAGPLANLAGSNGAWQLQGQGETSRTTVLNTSLTARVRAVLPNGNLFVHGVKEVVVNSERQIVELRGVVRPDDLTNTNSISSDRVGMLEVRVNGKGVVGDAVRRPFFLYRLLLGLLPL